jgi:hypothetical protein
MEENMAGVSVKFNLGATKPKIDVLKTKVRPNMCNVKIKNLINLKGNCSNIQLNKSR